MGDGAVGQGVFGVGGRRLASSWELEFLLHRKILASGDSTPVTRYLQGVSSEPLVASRS